MYSSLGCAPAPQWQLSAHIHRRLRSVTLACAVTWLLGWAVPPAQADYHESFESAEATWRLADADCGLRIVTHARSFDTSHSGHACEHIQLTTGRGTYVHLVHGIDRARVIAEWHPTLWVKADRSGLQFIARVVLPRSADPRTGSPLTTLLRGDLYERVGDWQQLTIRKAGQQLNRQVRVLRSQFGPDVDHREAYVDMVVLNAYGGLGETNVWIDDLEVTGHVRATEFASHRNEQPLGNERDTAEVYGSRPAPASDHSPARVRGSVLLVDGRPMFLRAIEYNGEPFALLKSIGFNAVKLDQTPSGVQLREAERVGLWLVAPPPGDGFITPSYDRVVAWDLGSGLTEDRLELIRQRVGELRRSDIRPNRPLVLDAVERIWNYSRLANVLLLKGAPLGSGLSLDGYGRWVVQHHSLARQGTPIWTTIQTEPATELFDQWAAIGLGAPTSMAIEPEQLRLLCFQAVASGTRGLLFTSRSSLERPDADTVSRVRALRHVNLELGVIEPWIAGGSRADDVDCQRDDFRIGVLQTERAQLLIVIGRDPVQQITASPIDPAPVSFVVPCNASSPQAYRLTPAGLQSLDHPRVAGGVRITLDDVGPVSLIAVIQDPLVINHLGKSLQERKTELARLQYELAADGAKLVESVHAKLVAQSQPATAADAWLEQARSNLGHCELLLGASDYSAAHTFAERALDALARVRRSHWLRAADAFPSPLASPYCVSYGSLPLHWEMTRRLQAAPAWSQNTLPAGDFESLDQLLATGWQNISRSTSKVAANVELSRQSPRAGRSALRLTAWPVDEKDAPIAMETPPVEIISAPVRVRRGQLIRIHGWAHVPEHIQGSQNGLMIADSFGGTALAQILPLTNGWQEFVLYRAAPRDGSAKVIIALTGIGQAMVDDLSIMLHDPIADRFSDDNLDEARRLPPVTRSYQ